MSANAYAAFFGCMLAIYWYETPSDKMLPWSTLLLGCLAIFLVAVVFWGIAGAVMGSNFPASHLPFSGACWGLLGAYLCLFSPLVKIGTKTFASVDALQTTPITWLQGVVLIGVMIVIALSGLLGWAIGDRITEVFKKADEAVAQEYKSGTSI
jgi:membrane associated rhomboid family serine protease